MLCTIGKSRAAMDCTASCPSPGQANTVSTITAPASRFAISSAEMVMTGVAAGKLTPILRMEAPVDPLRSKYAVLLVTARAPAGDVRYEDVKEQIRSLLTDRLTQQRYLDKLRRATLVDVRGV